jgi:hypothetical protein
MQGIDRGGEWGVDSLALLKCPVRVLYGTPVSVSHELPSQAGTMSFENNDSTTEETGSADHYLEAGFCRVHGRTDSAEVSGWPEKRLSLVPAVAKFRNSCTERQGQNFNNLDSRNLS